MGEGGRRSCCRRRLLAYSTLPSQQELYDNMWTGQHTYQRLSCWGCRFVADVVGRLDFTTVLDAGAGAWRRAWCCPAWACMALSCRRAALPLLPISSPQALSLVSSAGNGQIVRVMRLRGKAAWGVELSKAVLERDAPDLLKAGFVEQGTLADLPFQGGVWVGGCLGRLLKGCCPVCREAVQREWGRRPLRCAALDQCMCLTSLTFLPPSPADSQFDLVFSADVLEHIRPEEADAVIAELVRVAKRHIVMSISLKSWQVQGLGTGWAAASCAK